MSVRNAGASIREARIKSGLSLEKLSDSICSVASLSRIEHNEHGVSPSTFQALMSRTGYPCEIFPLFENWTDFECSFALIHARFHIDAWQLAPAYDELKKIEDKHWNNNKFHYQAWLMLYSMMQLRSGTANHLQVKQQLLNALHISLPTIQLENFQKILLSLNEIEILIYLAQEMLFTGQSDISACICLQLFDYLNHKQLTFMEKDKLLAECVIVYTKYLIQQGKYADARQLVNQHRHHMVELMCNAPLFELTFLTGVCDYVLGNISDAKKHFKDVLFAAHAIQSPYMTICKNYLTSKHIMVIPEHLKKAPEISLKKYPEPPFIDIASFSDGTFDIYGTDVITLGRLIHELRIRQKISQQTLCQGLCSTSMLSKIENNKIDPEIILAETLLQRLGLSTREFVFFGDDKEKTIHELNLKYRYIDFESYSKHPDILEKMKKLITDDNVIYTQLLLFNESHLIKDSNTLEDSNKRIQMLKHALSLTLKEFHLSKISDYRLSWLELTILNAIAHEYFYTDSPYIGLQYLYAILNYHKNIRTDCILQSQTLSLTLKFYYLYTYNLHHFKEAIDFFYAKENNTNILKYHLISFGFVCFYYCQTLGECKLNDSVSLFACYSCSIDSLYENDNDITVLKDGLIKDFSITINDY